MICISPDTTRRTNSPPQIHFSLQDFTEKQNILGSDAFIYKMLGSIMINVCTTNEECSRLMVIILLSVIDNKLLMKCVHENASKEQLYYCSGLYTTLDFRWKFNFCHICGVYHLEVLNPQHGMCNSVPTVTSFISTVNH